MSGVIVVVSSFILIGYLTTIILRYRKAVHNEKRSDSIGSSGTDTTD